MSVQCSETIYVTVYILLNVVEVLVFENSLKVEVQLLKDEINVFCLNFMVKMIYKKYKPVKLEDKLL